MYCSQCGNQLSSEDRFCLRCGKPAASTTSSLSPQPAAGPEGQTADATSHAGIQQKPEPAQSFPTSGPTGATSTPRRPRSRIAIIAIVSACVIGLAIAAFLLRPHGIIGKWAALNLYGQRTTADSLSGSTEVQFNYGGTGTMIFTSGTKQSRLAFNYTQQDRSLVLTLKHIEFTDAGQVTQSADFDQLSDDQKTVALDASVEQNGHLYLRSLSGDHSQYGLPVSSEIPVVFERE